MKVIIIAIIVQIVFALIIDLLYVKFDVLKWVKYDDVIYWVLMAMIALPLYVKGYLMIDKKKWFSVVLAIISFVVFGALSAMLGLLFHTKVLNAPL